MAKSINVQVKEALNPLLIAIRDQLAASPSPAKPLPAPPPKPGGWVSATPADAMLDRLEELIDELDTAASIPERVDTVGRLAESMKECQTIVLALDSRYKFNSIKLAPGKASSVPFSRIRGSIELAHRYYDRLSYYKTDAGKKFLKGVVSTTMDLDREGDVAVRDHHFDERLDPLASVRSWDSMRVYLPWARQQLEKNADPIEHIVEFLIGLIDVSDRLIEDLLWGLVDAKQARLHPTQAAGDWLNVEIRTHVPGDEKFSSPRDSRRMWTYQVKVPGRQREGQKAKEFAGSWEWTCNVWADNAVSLPMLRVVHTTNGPSSRHGITNDFTRGTLYAMRGPTVMRCYPSVRFHSALFDSELTSAAGMLVAEEGRVIAIDNRSGHYQPGYRQLQTAVRFLHSNLLFKHDAFVSLHVSNSDPGTNTEAEALYFSPKDFLSAAQSGMSFNVVAGHLAPMAQQYGYGLPVPARHAGLIPPPLSDFSSGRKRWDRMLASYYGGARGLETIVADLKAALTPSGTVAKWTVGRVNGTQSTAARREGDHASLASQTLQAIDSGGAYCTLPEILRKLMAATRASGGPIANAKDQASLISANQRYVDIAKRLAALTPNRGYF
ncbi:hypothetical protein [Reyranella soli]|uniref:Uncharacterized protein n=1 Tax=Reyranella soli TaxID=1230389 RepID=A0A512NIF5_9HYPH|nr:hypothetical protein [Reyranella soli]GEP58728.1 hypothetical protein RSO01_58940 [Reyranella soli]